MAGLLPLYSAAWHAGAAATYTDHLLTRAVQYMMAVGHEAQLCWLCTCVGAWCCMSLMAIDCLVLRSECGTMEYFGGYQ